MSSIFYFLCGVAIVFLIFWSGKWIVHILAITYGKYKLHKKVNNLPRETPLPSVSILKPLMGSDPNLEHNLETFFIMNYPVYELLFCIEDKNDPAVEIVEKLRDKYPTVESTLFLGGSNVGVNPKINNMYPGYQAAKYELIMISDSGIKMKEDTLLDMVENMTEKVGLVHQMPFTCDRDGFAATFEKIFFGTIQSRIYLCADLLGINCHTGMSCLIRKSVLDELGGLSKFGCYLAEDFFLAKSLIDSGWKMRISSQPAWQNSGICDIQSFQARLCRWAKLRVAMMPTTILLEPLSECLVVGAFASWSVGLLFGWDPLVFYLIHILIWFLSDWILLSIVQNGSLSFNKFEFVVGWAFREISGPYLFLHALYNPAIKWRTRLYKLQWGGVAYELEKTNSQNNENNASNQRTMIDRYEKPNEIAKYSKSVCNTEKHQKYEQKHNSQQQQTQLQQQPTKSQQKQAFNFKNQLEYQKSESWNKQRHHDISLSDRNEIDTYVMVQTRRHKFGQPQIRSFLYEQQQQVDTNNSNDSFFENRERNQLKIEPYIYNQPHHYNININHKTSETEFSTEQVLNEFNKLSNNLTAMTDLTTYATNSVSTGSFASNLKNSSLLSSFSLQKISSSNKNIANITRNDINNMILNNCGTDIIEIATNSISLKTSDIDINYRYIEDKKFEINKNVSFTNTNSHDYNQNNLLPICLSLSDSISSDVPLLQPTESSSQSLITSSIFKNNYTNKNKNTQTPTILKLKRNFENISVETNNSDINENTNNSDAQRANTNMSNSGAISLFTNKMQSFVMFSSYTKEKS